MAELPKSWERMIEDIKGTASDVWEDPWQRLVKDPGEESGGAGFRAIAAIGTMLAKGGVENLKEFMDAAKRGGGLDPYGENYDPMQALRKGYDVLTGGVWGGSAGATAGELGTIAGVKALRRPKTLSEAVFARGKAPREEILNKTGYFELPAPAEIKGATGADIVPRYAWEFSDEWAKLRAEEFKPRVRKGDKVQVNEYEGYLSNVLHHQELFKNYPEMADMPTKITVSPDAPVGGEGWFHGKDKGIEVTARDYDTALKTLGHEWQHAVSEIEGFPRGGSPEEFMKAFDIDYPTAYKMYRSMGGEELSSATAARLGYDPELRKLIPPWFHTKKPEDWVMLARGEEPSVSNPSVAKFFEKNAPKPWSEQVAEQVANAPGLFKAPRRAMKGEI